MLDLPYKRNMQIDMIYETIFSVCVLNAAHGIFKTIKDVYDYKLMHI